MTLVINRPNGTVKVMIMLDRATNKYRFVNLTNPHVCKCSFNSIEDAFADLDNNIKVGKVIKYRIIKDEKQ